jgi:hypothetical protein
VAARFMQAVTLIERTYDIRNHLANPSSPSATERQVEQIAADDFGAVYAVRSADETTVFEVILRTAA